LRLIAGLERPDRGDILLNGRSIVDVPPYDRSIAMVFQGQSLYPHMTVAQNMAFALKLKGSGTFSGGRLRMPCGLRGKCTGPHRPASIVSALGIGDLLGRRPHTLSGGQYQRAALAKALVDRRDVCLLDEPLANLDAQARLQLRAELRQVLHDAGATVVYVTHDRDEAMALGDRICVMNRGRVEQVGSPDDLYARPANRFVAEFVGTRAQGIGIAF